MNIVLPNSNHKHNHKFIFSVLWFDHDRGVPGKILVCRCGAECFESTVGEKIYKSYCMKGREYQRTEETDSTLLKK